MGGKKALLPKPVSQEPGTAEQPAVLPVPLCLPSPTAFSLPKPPLKPFPFYNTRGKCSLLHEVFLGSPQLGMMPSCPELPPSSDACFSHETTYSMAGPQLPQSIMYHSKENPVHE